ncbi:hypothetical protein NPD5_366 [Clostridium sporogenes]|uniref:Peptidase S8 n=1 Tax=Clostridium sporogenes TaxID=1509 RepID=A0A1L3NCA3_CLOSG|nr:S8 family serine peptidase [Clostridium sporogenes]APH13760.1 hypothetical protein NPD5_366 [Clostridium sporogenes]
MRKENEILNRILSFIITASIIFGNGAFLGNKIHVQAANEVKTEEQVKELFKKDINNYKDEKLKKDIIDSKKNNTDIKKEEDIVTLIVELEEKSISDYKTKKSLENLAKDKNLQSNVINSQSQYKNKIKQIDKDVKFKENYSILLNGFSLETKYKYKKAIEKLDGVKHVTLAKEYHKEMNHAIDLTGVSKVWKDYGYDGRGMVISIIDSGIDYKHKDMNISKNITPKLTKEKIQGMNNSIPRKNGEQSIGNGKFFTQKIPYGYNFADKNQDIIDTAEGTASYMHGMHVAGIAGANCMEEEVKKGTGIKGVAPECQLLAMKIFSNNPLKESASEDVIVSAIEDSIAHGADVINMSFGSAAGFQDVEDAQQIAVKKAIDNGIIVVSAAGNSYYSTYPNKHKDVLDTGVLGSPGLAEETIQVGSFENDVEATYALNYNISDKNNFMPYRRFKLEPTALKGEFDLVDCNLGKIVKDKSIDHFKNKNLKNKIALIKIGEIDINEKALNAQEKEAKAVILYDDEKESTKLDYIPRDNNIKIPVVFVKNSHGKILKDLIEKSIKISFRGQVVTTTNDDKGNVSTFSSWGPAPNLDLKPDITAIGGNIYSTVNNNSYTYMSGTSMSSPYTAGAMALMLQHIEKMNVKFDKPQDKVNFAKLLIMNTADVKKDKTYNELPYSPRRQGAGFLNIEKALKNKVTVTYNGKPSAALKTLNNKNEFTLTLHNYGDKVVSYKIDTIGGVLTEENKNLKEIPYDIKMEDSNIKFDPLFDSVTVEPGKDVNIKVTLNIGTKAIENSFVEGFITFIPKNSENIPIGMPFMGFYGDWGNLKVLDDPIYSKDTIFKETSLFTTVNEAWGGFRTYYLGGEDKNPDCFAINPDDKKAYNNAVPQISFLRNVKEFKIDVTDKDNKIIRTIEERKNIKKEIVSKQIIPAKLDSRWKWEGNIYDSQKGENISVPEGQYFINIKAKADYDNAKEQKLTMPIKIDKTNPKIKVDNIIVTYSLDCKLDIEASDNKNGSGIDKFLFLINGEKYIDKDGRKIFKLKKDENTNKYTMNLDLPEENENNVYDIHIGSTDYADNMAVENIAIIYNKKSKIDILEPKSSDKYYLGEDIVLKYNLKEDLKDLDHYEVFLDNIKNREENNGKNLEYTFKGGLSEGEHTIVVKALDTSGKTLDANAVKIKVQDNKDEKGLSIRNITGKTEFNKGEKANIKFKVSNYTDSKKKVSLILALYDEKETMINHIDISRELDKSTEEVLENTIEIPKEGNYKLKAFLWDSIENPKPLKESYEYKVK